MPTLVFVALLELVTWSGRSSTSNNALDDFLEEMEQRPKKEREDMVAAMDVRKQKPKEAERVNIVDEPKEMEPLKTIADTYIDGDEEGAPSVDKDDKRKDDTQVAAVDMGDNVGLREVAHRQPQVSSRCTEAEDRRTRCCLVCHQSRRITHRH